MISREDISPCVSFINKYLVFEISLGINPNACICTDRPENPRANEVRMSLMERVRFSAPEIISTAFVTSKKRDIALTITSLFMIAEINPIRAEKKMMQDITLIDVSPAFFIDSVKLKLCLVFSLDFVRDIFLGRKINPVMTEETIMER